MYFVEQFPLNIKGIVYKRYVRPAMLYGSETWCLGQHEIGILKRTERAMVRSMCGVKLMDKKSTKYLIKMFNRSRLRLAVNTISSMMR